jgi:hypothetical protein
MTEEAGTDNTLIRSVGCEICGARMLWTQGAWREASESQGSGIAGAAYRCDNGHVLDPANTPQCPNCGVHDTARLESTGTCKCHRCHASFAAPRPPTH